MIPSRSQMGRMARDFNPLRREARGEIAFHRLLDVG
jgi:hypothetical protein